MAAGILLLAFAAPASAGLVTTAADGGGAGTLRGEINSAVDTEIVEIVAGVNPVIDGTMGQITINDDITLRGQGAGTTTISVDTTPTLSRAFNVVIGTTATIEKLKITGGFAPDGTTPGPGPTAGTDGENGGAILNAGTLTLDHVTIDDNLAGSGGSGGPGVAGSSPTNGGNGGHGGEGAGVYSDGTLTIKDSTISNNLSGDGGNGGVGGLDTDMAGMGGVGGTGGNGGIGGRGGGVLAIGTLSITNSTINNNVASPGGDGGSGGNAVGGGPCPFGCGTGGGAGLGGGGGGLGSSATATLLNSTFENNTAGDGGDGGFGPSAQQEGAGGGSGGGIQAGGGNPLGATHLTIANNDAGLNGNGAMSNPGVGGGIARISGTTTLTNTLVVTNLSQDPGNADNCSGTIANGGHNIAFGGIGTAGCPGTFGTGNPMLGSLMDNGGPTKTMAIGLGAAAHNAVPAMGASCAATDQRGVTRPQPMGSDCDIGAFEVIARTLTVTLAGTGGGSVTATGINCGVDCTEPYADGASVVLTATASAGSSFSSWTGCDTPAGATCTMSMTADKAVTANFTLNPVPPPVITPPALTPVTPVATTPTKKKCKKGRKLKKGKCVKKKK